MSEDGITFRASNMIPRKSCGLMRDGQLVAFGKARAVMWRYRAGDVVCISHEDFDAITAEFAKDVTPGQALAAARQEGGER